MLQFFAILLIIAGVAAEDVNTVETDAWIKDAIGDLKFRVKELERGAGIDPSKKVKKNIYTYLLTTLSPIYI